MRRRSKHCYRRWRRGVFTWLWVGDNPYVATSQGEVGDLLHLPSAEGRQPHSIKLEVFALKLNRRARRVCLALGHPRNEPPVQEQQNAHTHENSFLFCFLFFLIKDEGDGDEGDLICPSLRDAEARRRWTSWPAANRAGEKWCNARARVPASGPPSPGPRMRAPAEERLYRPTCSSAIYYHKAAVISL